MSRINQVDPAAAEGKAQELLGVVKKKLGAAINITRVMANQPAVLEGYLNLSGAIAGGAFSPKTREAISLALAGANGCEYCASAHTFISGSLKVDADEISRQIRGEASDARIQAIVTLARAINEKRGKVSDADLQAARDAGLTDADIVETVGNVAQNVLTNYINNVAQTDIDFPVVRLDQAA